MAKKSKQPKWRTGNIIVNYTRVSDPSQFDNTSLETQKKDAVLYAERKGLIIKSFFGGVVESAKTDERKEFKRMLQCLRKDTGISSVLVYSYERFSRSENASQLIRDLARIGVKVLSVIQDIDVTTSAGKFQQNIFMAFGNYDNELRKGKTIRGMVENLENGYWVGVVPFGYTNLKRKEKAKYHEYVINEDGNILKLGFKWKSEGKLNNLEIVQRMQKMGSKIEYKSFVRIITNPFYCGYITHSLIPGKVIKGHHPALVTEEIFLRANNIVSNNPHKGIAKNYKKPELPLKSFMKSDETEQPFTGYIKKGHYYYKTRGKGIAVNERADVINELFKKELSEFKITEKHTGKIEQAVKEIVCTKLEDGIKEITTKKRRITELDQKKERLELRFIEREISKELYEKYCAVFEKEKQELLNEIGENDFESSNLEKAIKKGMEILKDPLQLWLSCDYDDKQRLQYMMFPEGIRYNKQKKEVRTPRVNAVFSIIADIARSSAKKNKGNFLKSSLHSHSVVPTGIEPVSKV